MPSGTTYNPQRVSDFIKQNLNFDAQGVFSNPAPGQVTNVDYTLTDDCMMTGAWVWSYGSNPGDSVSFQVVDSSGAFTGVAGTVLNQFITNWYMSPAADTVLDMAYPAKILAGMTLRVIYTSTGTTSPSIGVNYMLHKVLV